MLPAWIGPGAARTAVPAGSGRPAWAAPPPRRPSEPAEPSEAAISAAVARARIRRGRVTVRANMGIEPSEVTGHGHVGGHTDGLSTGGCGAGAAVVRPKGLVAGPVR